MTANMEAVDPQAVRLPVATTSGGHSQTISRHLVHRCAVSEVFVTSLTRTEDAIVIGAQLPRMHSYFGDHTGVIARQHDPLAVMEVARQAAIAVSHEFFDAPTDSAFLVRTFNGTAISDPVTAESWAVGSAPADLDIVLTVDREHELYDTRCGLDTTLVIRRRGAQGAADAEMMRVDGSFTWIPPQQWAALRAGAVPPPRRPEDFEFRVDPDRVRRTQQRNVVIGEVEATRNSVGESDIRVPIIVDPAHATLFDHPLDHVPGSLLLEAARQAALALHPEVYVTGLRATFSRFVEHGIPAYCIAGGIAERSSENLTIVVEQAGKVCGEIIVALTPGEG